MMNMLAHRLSYIYRIITVEVVVGGVDTADKPNGARARAVRHCGEVCGHRRENLRDYPHYPQRPFEPELYPRLS